ncbi:MAG: hypothetical protein HFG14_03775 [Lachnospiraceae bacterium]|jgi:hypothetical protein|nr:hypothetical protein [Lachnospiraceae bacterium]
MIKKTWTMAVAALCFCILAGRETFAAGGEWNPTEEGMQYIREDRSLAKGSWEDIEGEWYHFDNSGLMQTGWHKIGNMRYHFEENGALSKGWQCYSEDGGEKWYYFDTNGNAVIRWLEDEGKWYWFHANGILNMESRRTIEGRTYYFHEDGSLIANEFAGFRYFDRNGEPDGTHDVRAERIDGHTIQVEDDVRDEIAKELNALPSGWLIKFLEEDWSFVYCPEKEYFSAARFEDGGDRYYVRHKLNSSERTLRFTSPEGIKAGFGEFIYRNTKEIQKEYRFSWEADYKRDEIQSFLGLPDTCMDDYSLIFGELFARYLDEVCRAEMEEQMGDVLWVLTQAVESRGEDGRPRKQ